MLRDKTRQKFDTMRWKICARLKLWKLGDWAMAHLPEKLARKIWTATLPF